MESSNNKKIAANDINYAIYKIGNWKNDYEINQIGLSNEIPVTKNTLDHVKLSMDEIRRAEFEISNTAVNGSLAIAFQISPKIHNMDLDKAIDLEENEYVNIMAELADLELLNDEEYISLDDENYLIYKLEKECHVTQSIPANEHTKEYHNKEIKKIEDSII